MDHRTLVDEAIRVGVEVASSRLGAVADPLVLQDTNNAVLWLRPHPVVAKVGLHPHSAETLTREHAVARFAGQAGAPVAIPLPGVAPIRHSATGFVVTLWVRIERSDASTGSGVEVGNALRKLHAALQAYDEYLPDFRENLRFTRIFLQDDRNFVDLPTPERSFLRRVFDDYLGQVEDCAFAEQVLHGEPHANNFISTRTGVRWLDLETVCRGPLEWDLASLPHGALVAFPDRDEELLQLFSTLNSARVATWCWNKSAVAEMRQHGEHHLRVVHERVDATR